MGQHIPVLKDVILEKFQGLKGNVLDATFGGGGHSKAILDANPNICLWAIDRDPEAEKRAEPFKKNYGDRFFFKTINFSALSQLGQVFCGVLFDLGVSSFQLDQAVRGFSFRQEGPLDMRMDLEGQTAKEFLESATELELVEAIRDFGEEKNWRKVVKHILAGRGTNVFNSTASFVEYLRPVLSKKSKIHPATLVFQGIRMAVNEELKNLRQALPQAFEALETKGILAVISFHSLEDRTIKQYFNRLAGKSLNRMDSTPKQLRTIHANLLSTKPITPSFEEREHNMRSRSAKLRLLEKIL